MTETPEYISKQEAASRLKMAERTVHDLGYKGKIRTKKIVDPERGNQKVVLFNAADVERLAYERQNPSESPLPLPVKQMQDDIADSQCGALMNIGSNMLGRLIAGSGFDIPQPGPIGRDASPWLTLDQAAIYTGLPCSALSQQIKAGRLPVIDTWGGKDRKGGGLPGGRYRIKRSDLDAMEGVRL